MWEQFRNVVRANGKSSGLRPQPGRPRARQRPLVEILESRQLMTASLAPISDLTSVPAKMGFQVPLDGSGTTSPSQTFTATSDNPNIQVSIAQGPFWTITVSHQASSTGDVSFTNAPMTFQLFQNQTPNTVARITNFTNNGYYVNTGKFFPRILKGFVAQGGSDSATSTSSSSGVAPIATEIVQQLNFSGTAQLAMAKGQTPVSTDAQFFVTFGPQTALDYGFTLFGQLISGQSTLTDLSLVAVQSNNLPPPNQETSVPVSPVTITSATLSNQNPNGVLLIDTTSATTAGQTANITVTATDPTDGTSVTRTFKVTTVAYNGPTDPSINFVPTANPVNVSITTGATQVPVQLSATSNYPDTTKPGTFTFSIVSQPSHGTITQFNPATGSLVYVPNAGFGGMDSFQFSATSSGSATGAPASAPSLPATATIQVNTHIARLINDVLIVTPPPRTDHGTDNIVVSQQADATVAGGQKIVVTINGIPDATQPPALALTQIVVFATKVNSNIQVDPSVTVPTTLDGGHGGKNVIKGGGGPTREHGWFGHTLLVGGTGPNQLIGRKGVVRFKPSSTTTEIFAGVPRPRSLHNRYRAVPPGGTFYRFVGGRLVPIKSF
jgi:cyclophilin family peptidyl-prolyl cis-trans isomerase